MLQEDTMLGCAARKAVAALRAVPKAPGVGKNPHGARLRGRPGEQQHGLCAALTLAVVPAQLLPGMSMGGGARSAAVRAGTDALSSIAMGRGTRCGWRGVSRRLVSSTGESAGGGSNAFPDGRPEGGGNDDSIAVEFEPRQLTKDIYKCTDAKGLLGVVEQHGASFNVMHVSAALSKLARVRGADSTGDDGLLLQRLRVMVKAKMQETGSREVASILRSMAKLSGRKSVDDELVGELKARAMAMAGDFEPKEVANLMQALQEMGITDPDAGLLEAMQARAAATAGDFKPTEVANLHGALAKMGIKPDAGLAAAMKARAVERGGDFKARASERAGGVQRQEARADRSKSHEATASCDGAGGGGGREKEDAHADRPDPGLLVSQLTRCSDAGGLLRSTLNPEP